MSESKKVEAGEIVDEQAAGSGGAAAEVEEGTTAEGQGEGTEGSAEKSLSKEAEIAQWMVETIRDRGMLRQEEAIEHVRGVYGEAYVFVNEAGNVSLEKEVKKAFRKLHRGRIAWDRDGFFWAWT
ncbi:hypothetical protein B8V81_2300 [Paenibacillus pasadenensis]|uniref:Integron gene cassette protein n=2 Tax=Paenibacillus TaxID=44249 RepID=A0A2N5N0L1_9BACL|nr:hypothetical protein B8V81_2300 [Paenibacillus pasadenensis]